MALSYPFIKAIHELAHGWLAKARGGEIREMGIMFLVFFPVPYVDASSAAAFPSRWDRAAVAAGGIFAETFIAAVAVIVWASVEPGFTRALAYNLILIGGISTLIINGNPLLKFDGYYVLSDLLESPNLATRSNNYYGHLIQRYVFGATQIKEETATPGERVWFLIYAPAAFVYRMVVMLGIALYVSAHAFILGVLIALWTLFNAIVKPAFKHLRHVVTSPKLRKVRGRAMGWTFGTIGVVVAALLLVPMPLRTDTEGVIWLPDEAHVRARTSGFIAEMPVPRGTMVDTTSILARLVEPTLQARLDALEWRAEEYRRRVAALSLDDRPGAEVARLQLSEALAELGRETERGAQLSIRAPLGGRFEPALANESLIGRFVTEGDVIGYVLPPRPDRVRIVVAQDNNVLVRQRLTRIELKLAGYLEERHEVQMLREVPSALNTLPSAALGKGAGGRFLTDPTDPDQLRVLEQVFLYDLSLPDSLATAPYGARVLVRFDHGLEPAGLQVWRRLRQLLLKQFNA
jgi:putative peptide zinc metalloprotease protein